MPKDHKGVSLCRSPDCICASQVIQTASQEATGGKARQRAVLPVHDVPLAELTGKLRAVWACCGGAQDLAAVKQVLTFHHGKSWPSIRTACFLPREGFGPIPSTTLAEERGAKPTNASNSLL